MRSNLGTRNEALAVFDRTFAITVALQLLANCFLGLGIVLAGVLADRTSATRVLTLGALATVLLGLAFGPGLGSGSALLVALTLSFALLVMGLVYGPLGAWLPTLFPVRLRYTGISVAFNTGGIVGGAVTPVLAQVMANAGWGAQAGWLLSVAGLVTLLGVRLARTSAAAV